MGYERPKWWTCGCGGQVDFKTASLHIRRANIGTPATHPLSGREMREFRRHQRESAQSPFVLVPERGALLSAPGCSRMVERAATAADLRIKAHAHMLRHACGYKLANDGRNTRESNVALSIWAARRPGTDRPWHVWH
jgi:integrase